jgi:hypothetical protein
VLAFLVSQLSIQTSVEGYNRCLSLSDISPYKMRTPFSRKGKGVIRRPLIDRESQGYSVDDSSGVQSDYAVHLQSSLANRRNFDLDPYMKHSDMEKKGVANWVKKLNCSASKKQLELDNMEGMQYVQSARKKDASKPPWGSFFQEAQPATDITRQVLITVKDGEIDYATPNYESRAHEMKNSYLVGERTPPKSRFRISILGSQNQPVIASPSRGTRRPLNQLSGLGASKDMNDMLTAQEVARKNRWRKGLEEGWEDDADIPSLLSDQEDQSTDGGRSVQTGYDTVGTGHTPQSGYTTDITEGSDDSDDISAKPRGGYRKSQPRSSARPAQDNSLLAGVAEDLGIIAGLLLQDGNACFSGAAAITKETITNCNTQV